MIVSKDELLIYLPPFVGNKDIIKERQEIHDIMKEVLEAHKIFASNYDLIYQFFDSGSIKQIAERLFDFCKTNIIYKIESEDNQTTKSPSAFLATGTGDCKHYAGFIAGVLDAINRNDPNRNINWFYRFASYSYWNRDPEHVFVVVIDKGKEIWIDPVLSFFNSRAQTPKYFQDRKVKNMLSRVSGIGMLSPIDIPGDLQPNLNPTEINYGSTYLQDNAQTTVLNIPVSDDYFSNDIPETLQEQIKMLLYYGIIDSNMNVYNDKFTQVIEQLNDTDAADLSNSFGSFLQSLQNPQSIGNIFSSVWGTVKQVSLAVPRGAYLSLVSLNVFGLATHLNKCITFPDGSTDQNGIDRLQGVWHKKLSGDTNILLRAIRNGRTKKQILGVQDLEQPALIGVAPAIPAWVTAATAIMVAMTPIITAILKSKNQFDPITQSQLGMQPLTGTSNVQTSITKYLPYLIIGGAIYFVMGKKKIKF